MKCSTCNQKAKFIKNDGTLEVYYCFQCDETFWIDHYQEPEKIDFLYEHQWVSIEQLDKEGNS